MLRRYFALFFSLSVVLGAGFAHGQTSSQICAAAGYPLAQCLVMRADSIALPESHANYTLAKVLNTSTHYLTKVALSSSGSVLNEISLLQNEALALYANHGNLMVNDSTYAQLAAEPPSTPVAARLFLPLAPTTYRRGDLLTRSSVQAYQSDLASRISIAVGLVSSTLNGLGFTWSVVGSGVPIISVGGTIGNLLYLRTNPHIGAIYLDGAPGTWVGGPTYPEACAGGTCPWWVTQEGASSLWNVNNFIYGLGEFSMVAVDEPGQPPNPDPDSNVIAVIRPQEGPIKDADAHAHAVAAVINNTVSMGIAPGAGIIVANSDGTGSGPFGAQIQFDYMFKASQLWGATTINESWVESDGSRQGIDAQDAQNDANSLVYPYPLNVVGAGNIFDSHKQFVENEPLNGIAVGGTTDRGAAPAPLPLSGPGAPPAPMLLSEVWSGGSWQNPYSTHNDREEPAVCAPAEDINVVNGVWTGTSLAAPSVSGVGALIDTDFQQYPVFAANDTAFQNYGVFLEEKKAIIMATAFSNPEDIPPGSYQNQGNPDLHCGVGEANAWGAVDLVLTGKRVPIQGTQSWNNPYPNTGSCLNDNQGVVLPLNGGTVGGDFDQTSYLHGFNAFWGAQAEFDCPAGLTRSIRAVLTFDASADACQDLFGGNCGDDSLEADLDLYAFDGTTGALVAGSISYDNSYEVIDMPVSNGQLIQFRVVLSSNYTNGRIDYIGFAWYPYCSWGSTFANQ